MAVTLFVGGDAGVGGDGANGIGQDDLQRDKGERSGMYERSEGAEMSRRIGIPKEGVNGKTPIRPRSGAAGTHTWRGNALPARKR